MKTETPLIAVVDDDQIVRSNLSRLIQKSGWNVETFSCAYEFINHLPLDAACVLLDVQIPGMTGLQLQDWMNEKRISSSILFLTSHGDVLSSVRAMKSGAVDFLLKPIDDEALLAAVHHAIDIHALRRAQETDRNEINKRHSCLTTREREVLGQVIGGRLNKQIASDLGISLKTVKVHRARAMEKMGVRSVAALVHACHTAGIETDYDKFSVNFSRPPSEAAMNMMR
jgi:FixJ family two-component response regulator